MTTNADHHRRGTAASISQRIFRIPFEAADAGELQVQVEQVGDHTIVAHVLEKNLHFTAAQDHPAVRDLDFATVLGFERPRNIRNLIRRMESDGKLRGIDWRSTVKRQSTGNGASREFTVTEAWLTREQALLVATQSNTPRAWELTTLMVRVFDAVVTMLRDAHEARVGVSIDDLTRAVERATAPLRAELSDLRARFNASARLDGEAIGRAVAEDEITRPIRGLAGRLVVLDGVYSRKQHIGRLHIEMREAIGASPKLRVEDFDTDLRRRACGWVRARGRDIDRRERAVRSNGSRRNRAAQGTLPLN